MKRLFLMLALLLVMTGCKHGDNIELWNDLKVGDDVYHFTLVEFGDNNQIVCTGEREGLLALRLTLGDGTPVTRKHMLQCPEGYHIEYSIPPGTVLATMQGNSGLRGNYCGIGGRVVVERHEFKTTIAMHDLQLAHLETHDTIDIVNGYLSFDLSFF